MRDRLKAFFASGQAAQQTVAPTHPLQRPKWFMPGLRAEPFPSPERFPWVRTLERASIEIAGELRALQSVTAMDRHPEGDALVGVGRWDLLQLFRGGRLFDANCARCPTTMRLLEAIPGALEAGSAYFSMLRPQTHVRPHCGPTNTRIRCHLPLTVPLGAELRVAGESRAWRRGQCLLFDDSFEHEAINPTRRGRVVLLFDVWHPDLTAREKRKLLAWLARPIDETIEDAWHPVGALRAFAQ